MQLNLQHPSKVRLYKTWLFFARGKLSDELEDYMMEDDRNTYTLELEDTENWLYEDGEYADRPVYQVYYRDGQSHSFGFFLPLLSLRASNVGFDGYLIYPTIIPSQAKRTT